MFSASSNVDLYASGKEVVSVKMPDVSSKGKSKLEDKDRDQPMPHQSQIENIDFAPYSSHQIPDLVTLSLLPKSQWQSLVNLDIIKVSFHLSICHLQSVTFDEICMCWLFGSDKSDFCGVIVTCQSDQIIFF